jgi:hypothetical protein
MVAVHTDRQVHIAEVAIEAAVVTVVRPAVDTPSYPLAVAGKHIVVPDTRQQVVAASKQVVTPGTPRAGR